MRRADGGGASQAHDHLPPASGAVLLTMFQAFSRALRRAAGSAEHPDLREAVPARRDRQGGVQRDPVRIVYGLRPTPRSFRLFASVLG